MSLAIALLALIVACCVALKIGDVAEREGAWLMAVCWAVSIAGQAIFGSRRLEPLIAADALYGLGLLALTYRYNKVWMWAAVCLQGGAFFMHALLYERTGRPSHAYLVAINVLSMVELAVLVAGAVRSRYLRLGAPRACSRPDQALHRKL